MNSPGLLPAADHLEPGKPCATQVQSQTGDAILRTIAVFKFVKALGFLAAGLAALEYLDPKVATWIEIWAQTPTPWSDRHAAKKMIEWLSGLGPHRIRQLGLGAFMFSAVLSIEGVGLWLGRRWAEWLAVMVTSLFIPLEIWELLKTASAYKAFALVLNALVVGYLVWRIRRDKNRLAAGH